MSNCALCKSPLQGIVEVRLGDSWLESCPSCKSWTYLPRPPATAQAAIHDSAEYFEHPYFEHRRKVQDVRCRNLFMRIQRTVPSIPLQEQKLLDIGCDTGAFLESAARQFHIRPMGIDVSRRAVEQAEKAGIPAFCGQLSEAPPSFSDFSIITAIDLIEHVTDPHEFLLEISNRISPTGIAYLETPNIESLVYKFGAILCKITGGRPKSIFERLFPAQHLQYMTTSSITRLAKGCEWEVLSIEKRGLFSEDLNTSIIVKIPLTILQFFDWIFGRGILLCVTLRKGSRDGK